MTKSSRVSEVRWGGYTAAGHTLLSLLFTLYPTYFVAVSTSLFGLGVGPCVGLGLSARSVVRSVLRPVVGALRSALLSRWTLSAFALHTPFTVGLKLHPVISSTPLWLVCTCTNSLPRQQSASTHVTIHASTRRRKTMACDMTSWYLRLCSRMRSGMSSWCSSSKPASAKSVRNVASVWMRSPLAVVKPPSHCARGGERERSEVKNETELARRNRICWERQGKAGKGRERQWEA